jgi:MoaA/NifB/PqqE/SkfB family radical SAM enzyme
MCLPHFTAQEQIHGIPKGMMDMETYGQIVDGIAKDGVRFDHMIFQWLGDPSLHPQLEKMIAIAQDRLSEQVGYLRIDTNAIVLTPERMDRLIEVYARKPELPLLVVFTMDAVSPEVYTHVKGQDALERVRRNVRHFIMRRAQLPFEDVRLNAQFQFVLQTGNAHEARDFVAYWQNFLRCHGGGRGHDEIMIKRLSLDAGGAGQEEADVLYEETIAAQGIRQLPSEPANILLWEKRAWESTAKAPGSFRQPCPGMWLTPVIRHDGHLMMCCVDLSGQLDLGDLKEHSFRTLWEGDLATSYRLAHIRGQLPGPCESCGGINWYETPPEFVKAWLKKQGQEALWPEYNRRLETHS